MPRTIVAACAIALVGLVAACGGPDQPQSNTPDEAGDHQSVAELAAAMQQASAENQAAQLTITLDGAAAGTGALLVDDKNSDLSVAWEQGDLQRSTRVVDDTAYVQAPDIESEWVQVDPNAPANTPSATLRYLAEQSIAASDPVRTLVRQADAAQIVNTEVEEVDGVKATRYDIEVDLITMAENAEPADAQLYATSIQAGNDTVSSTMWTDENDLPLRYVSEMTAVNGMITTTDVAYAWGESTEITPPDSEAVVQASEITSLDEG